MVDRILDLRRIDFVTKPDDFLTAINSVPEGWVKIPLLIPFRSVADLLYPPKLYSCEIEEFKNLVIGSSSRVYLAYEVQKDNKKIRILQADDGTLIVFIFHSLKGFFFSISNKYSLEESFVTSPISSISALPANISHLIEDENLRSQISPEEAVYHTDNGRVLKESELSSLSREDLSSMVKQISIREKKIEKQLKNYAVDEAKSARSRREELFINPDILQETVGSATNSLLSYIPSIPPISSGLTIAFWIFVAFVILHLLHMLKDLLAFGKKRK